MRWKEQKAPLGFEPRISCLLDRRFNQLSHGATLLDEVSWRWHIGWLTYCWKLIGKQHPRSKRSQKKQKRVITKRKKASREADLNHRPKDSCLDDHLQSSALPLSYRELLMQVQNTKE